MKDNLAINSCYSMIIKKLYPRGDIRMLSYLPRQNSANKKPVHPEPSSLTLISEGGVCVALLCPAM